MQARRYIAGRVYVLCLLGLASDPEQEMHHQCRLIEDGNHLLYGPDVILRLMEVELGFLAAGYSMSNQVGYTLRYTNWTVHPSLTPGDSLSAKGTVPGALFLRLVLCMLVLLVQT